MDANVMTKRLLITTGDPAGVGPELALKTIDLAESLGCVIGLVGSADLLRRVAGAVGVPMPEVVSDSDFISGRSPLNQVCVIDRPGLAAEQVVPGRVDRATGTASLDYVNFAIDAILEGRADAMVTGPIHKEAWHQAGAKYPGHTELLAERAGEIGSAPERHCMMLAAPDIRCALVTVHVGLGEVPKLLTTELVLKTIELAGCAVESMIKRPPRITVLGLNPHAGEGGLFGEREEEQVIEPAIIAARELFESRGWVFRGPLPPDTAFVPAMRGKTDVFVCMYHDQGLIPLKALAFDEAVNVTLGLRIVRTSVDHGTALDLAWRGEADDRSMRAAIKLAFDLLHHSNGTKSCVAQN
jgi:4-hydroxythreonine-4-phosphate dehydrogenase